MIRRAVLCALLMAAGVHDARGQANEANRPKQGVVVVRDAGPGAGPAFLVRALQDRYLVIGPAADPARIARDSVLPATTIVLGRTTYVDGTVHGDLIVVGGDLFMHPGGRIDGRAVAIGGGVYESALATIGRGIAAYRDFTYDIEAMPGGYALRYRALAVRTASLLAWLGPLSARLPTYDRSNGLSLPVAALLDPFGRALEIVPEIRYRTQLGAFDPSVAATLFVDRATTVTGTIGRGTFSNDAWIWSDAVNSIESFVLGEDSRNYYRGTRGEVVAAREVGGASLTLRPHIGARWERVHDVRPDTSATGGPWSLHGRRERDDMLRPNPAIDPGSIASLLGGVDLDWSEQGLAARLSSDVEAGRFSRACSPCTGIAPSAGFAQLTLDGSIAFPTFGAQSLGVAGHAVITGSRRSPRQRWAYVGGAGTIATLSMLERGGDELAYLDSRYDIPLQTVSLPFVGSPVLTLRHVIGGAAVGTMPSLAQAAGVRVSAGPAHVEVLIDPATRHLAASAGISLSR